MKFNEFLALTAAADLAFSVNAYAAKGIKIVSNNTSYGEADVQKPAATATGMGVKEPASPNAVGGTATISGSGTTKCTFKVGADDTPQIQGINCKWSACQPN